MLKICSSGNQYSLSSNTLFLCLETWPFRICRNKWCYELTRIPHCKKSLRIWSYSGPYSPAFWLTTERYSVSLCIQSECGKIRTTITPNTETFHELTRIPERGQKLMTTSTQIVKILFEMHFNILCIFIDVFHHCFYPT